MTSIKQVINEAVEKGKEVYDKGMQASFFIAVETGKEVYDKGV